MHQRRIAHGNLKPGNIFFDENGELFLTDFAMGQMPGVGVLPYTDALLYAPPEQLRDPEGYLSGKGYAWDTYAFAVLAFRLLTGKFPRCEATFSRGLPAPGEGHMTGIEADLTNSPNVSSTASWQTGAMRRPTSANANDARSSKNACRLIPKTAMLT